MRPALSALLACALLTGCSSVRPVRLAVRDASTGEPAPGVRVRVVSLDTGTAPLPLNADTLDEILATGSVASAATTDHAGEAHLRLRGRVGHLVELTPPPFASGESPMRPVGPRVWRFYLHEGARSIEPVDAHDARRYAVEVSR